MCMYVCGGFVCMCVNTCMQRCTCTYIPVSVETQGWHQASSSIPFLPCSLRQPLWIKPSSHQDGQSCSGGPCLPSTSQDWDYRWVAMPTQYLHGFWVSDLQYSCSCVKHVSFGSIFPASKLLLLKNILHSLNRIPQNTPFSNQVTGW